MKGRFVIVSGLVAYLCVVGCVMWPAPAEKPSADAPQRAVSAATPPRADYSGLPYRGMVLQVQRIDRLDEYKKALDGIADLGADTVSIVVDSRQENGTSGVIFLDMRISPSPEKLTELIRYAKSKKLRVLMMPIVLLQNPRGNEWRGTIKPESWEEWFDSYRQVMLHYARVAQDGGADVFSVGSELVSTEKHRDEWRFTIQQVRGVFHGQLTYSANWDHYQSIPFWDQLDLISTNSYYKLGENRDVPVTEIVSRWKQIQRDFLPWVQSKHKPFMFTEVGWCSVANAAHEPWDYTQTSVPIDLDLQKKLYEGFFEAWYNVPELGGFMIWQYSIGDGGPHDRGYTPLGKPAEQVLRTWMAKPRWRVNP